MANHPKLQDPTLLEGLRRRTKGIHEQLHHHGHFVALFDGEISRDDYADLLSRFYSFYAPLEYAIETALQMHPNTHGGYSYSKRANLIQADIVALGLDVPVAGSHCEHVLNVVTPETLGGVLYVIEGSTLGAAQIDRAAQKLLGKETFQGRQFWAWCRSENKNRWSMTIQYLEHLQSEGGSHEKVFDGASDTFQALSDWLAPIDRAVSRMKLATA